MPAARCAAIDDKLAARAIVVGVTVESSSGANRPRITLGFKMFREL
jgi:hypothetical protein